MKDVNSFIDKCALAMFAILQGAAFAAIAWAVFRLWR